MNKKPNKAAIYGKNMILLLCLLMIFNEQKDKL